MRCCCRVICSGEGDVKVRTLLVLLGLLAAALVVWRSERGAHMEAVDVTTELSGRWTTEAPGYADRFLEIRSDRVVFGRGGDDAISHTLVGAYRESEEDGAASFVLAYEGEDVEQPPVELKVRRERDRLVLANQPNVSWTRAR